MCRSVSFEEFWLQLRKAARGVEMDVFYERGCLKMQWTFDDRAKMQKVLELLEAKGARRQVCQDTVCFWVEVNEQGRFNVATA